MADSFVKEAFLMRPNLVGLGIGVVAATALPFTGPLLLGVAALEGLYLWSMSNNPRFQRMVRSRRSEERRVGKECRSRWSRCDGKKRSIRINEGDAVRECTVLPTAMRQIE